ncbi:PD-(D/E)XK nuclease family protein [Candidatus Woesearchaeota archaeon]|nr:PD-(D/E)XK nuclease family protein [Candidatus Woesearchaeota archaeon]
MPRIQSPSSINTFKQCPRKYYYQYIEKLPTATNIHLVRGSIVHEALDRFFDVNALELSADPPEYLKNHMQMVFEGLWREADFDGLELTEQQLFFFKEESRSMLMNWLGQFLRRFSNLQRQDIGPLKAFLELTPEREQEYVSEKWKVKGFIDAIENNGTGVRLMDYKTSKRASISDEYMLQLSIYTLLYQEKHRELPNEVGIYFLKEDEQTIPVTESMLDLAKLEIRKLHERTKSESIGDYPRNIGPLCKWATGQCDFYDTCFGRDKDVHP